MTNRLSLRIFKGGDEVGVEHFEREIIKIGRLASAHLKLDDPRVSRIHAVIEVAAGGQDISIIDMGSAEGTFVNGEKVTKVKLVAGDEIRLGETRLVLERQMAQPVAAAAAAEGDEQAAVDDGEAEAAEAVSEPAAQEGVAVAVEQTAAMPQQVVSPTVAAPAWSGPVPAAALSPGVAGFALVDPLPTAPPMNWYDPYGEYNHVIIEPEEPVSSNNRCLEIAVMWEGRLLDVRHYNQTKQVTLGESKGSDIFVVSEGLPEDNFPLVRYMDGEYVLTYFDGLEGEVDDQGHSKSLAALGGHADDKYARSFQYPLPISSVTRVDYGGLSLQLRFVTRPGVVAGGPFDAINYSWLNVFLISVFLHGGFFATTALYPYDTTSLQEDLFSAPNRFAQFILNPPEKEKNSLLSKLLKQNAGKSAAKHAERDGKAGKEDSKDKDKRMASKSDKPTNEMVVQNKLNQLFGGKGGNEGVASVFGGGLGGELIGALGGVSGAQIGDSYGFGGLGVRGSGPGGGGASTSTFGVGSIGTRGRGGGASGYGSGTGGLGGKKEREIDVSQGTPVIMGSLDKEIIRRIIRENISQIRYCYERELARSPGLYGKVMVKFIIAANGRVSNAQIQQTTMNNAEVENCIVRKVRGWKFPKPKGGGIVIVSYPFIFKQSG